MRFPALVLAFCTGLVSLSFAGDLSSHPFFDAIEGDWVGEGELVEAEGKTIPVREEWTGSWTADGTFLMEGRRQWNDEEQEFRWAFSYNTTTELFECAYRQTGMDDPVRFEVSLTDKRARIVSQFGDGGSDLVITNRLTEEGIEGEVFWKNENGQDFLAGTVLHRREP